MYEWKFTTDDNNDIVAIATALRDLGAKFNPERDQLVTATEPGGYATSEEGPAIIRDVTTCLAEAGVTPPNFPEWGDLTHRQRGRLLETAAGSWDWIENGSFKRSDLPVCELAATHILYEIAGVPAPAPEE